MSKTLFTVLLVWSTSFSLFAASGIKGKVIDASSQAPVEYAHVILYSGDKVVAEVMTDLEGGFQMTPLTVGEYTLMVRMLGYDLFTQSVLVENERVKDAGIMRLRQLEVGLGEVEVVANKKQVIYKLDKRVIEASSNMMASGGSAVDILENTPSIRVDAEGEVTFRGSSGFAVYVDGKPSIFSGTQALEQIPSAHIDNIEIITNPSARHDTEGAVGIINIITKKDMQQGVSGMVNLSGSTALTRTVDFLLTNQQKASRWFVGGSYSERLRESDFNQQKTTIVGDASTISHSDGPRKSNNFNYALKAGWQYALPQTTFDVDFEGGYGGRTRDGDLDYSEVRQVDGEATERGDYFSRDYYDIHETFFQGNVGMLHKFNDKGHQLSARFYAKYGGDALEYFQSDLFDKNNQRQQGHRAYEDEHRWTTRGNLDYIYPYSATGKLEAGYQYFSYLEDGDYSMEFWDPVKKEFYWSDEIYNTFYFMHGINSIYAIWGDSYKSFEFQAGLRGEHTHRVLRSSVEGSDRIYNKFELFPSVHLGYHFPNEHVLMASYSRRITRPQLFYMEPYITYRDYYSAEIGNPDIRAEYINSYELNYKKNIGQHSVSASVFHRSRKDKIERLRVPYVAGVTLDSMANVGSDYSTGVELSLQVQAARWWNINVNGSLYHYKVKNKLQNLGTDENSTNYEIALNNGFDAGKYTRIQVDGNFVGPSVTTQGRTDAFWYMNLAVRQQLFNRKVAATLSFRDVFNSARYVSNISTSNLESITKIRPQYPLIMLSISYTFNNFKARASQGHEGHDLFEGTNH
ncbi:TonB-dependent receptor [Parabacteroides sp. PF5-6]|uniref:TonB-dependent receptor domain-containing protein n=1 Tax=Parabacteroides sp. PF5-6 TaxID=1742403 RepID=UPI00240613F9|nr:TonB-dependent receptor [Parabacteroides sp. PF5-6]MDF9831132.1 outer membrane receptor protein involved in Fe transport [Parabacteroides sp. PF5-6]